MSPTTWMVPGVPLRAWSGPDGASLVLYRTLPVPGASGMSLLGGHTFGRVLGYIFGVLVIVQSFAIIQYAPWYSAAMIALGVLAVYGVAKAAPGDSA